MTGSTVVLVGGGHAHALVLAALRGAPFEDAQVILVNPGGTAPYSGMLPGFVAGHYSRASLEIDLVALSAACNARFVDDFAVGLDPDAKILRLKSGAEIPYDLISFDVGITTRMPALEGFSEHGVPAKPLGVFAKKWDAFIEEGGPQSVAVLGGGVAGAELAMAMAFALHSKGQTDTKVHLLDRSEILSELSRPMRARVRRGLAHNGVEVHANTQIDAVTATHILRRDDTPLAADFVVGAAGASAHDWTGDTALDLKDGFIRVNAHLQASDGSVFAVGDCAHMDHAPRPKAGVYAVRQAPVLTANLRAALAGIPLKSYQPQDDYLKLISLGRKSAIGVRGGIPFSGGLVWRLKDWIDRKFMEQF